jgi:hypothetical protein
MAIRLGRPRRRRTCGSTVHVRAWRCVVVEAGNRAVVDHRHELSQKTDEPAVYRATQKEAVEDGGYPRRTNRTTMVRHHVFRSFRHWCRCCHI